MYISIYIKDLFMVQTMNDTNTEMLFLLAPVLHLVVFYIGIRSLSTDEHCCSCLRLQKGCCFFL